MQPQRAASISKVSAIQDLDKAALNQMRNEQIGLVFQFHNLLPELTALENVLLPRWIGKKMDEVSEKDALEKLAFLGIADRAHHLPNELSGGEQQRVWPSRERSSITQAYYSQTSLQEI